jgi:preprotein translocase subunit SecD
MRLVVAEGPQSEPPKDAEQLALMVTNSATGQTYGNVFWVSKTVLIDQNDLQTTTVVESSVPDKPQIDVTFTPEGTKRFAEVSRQSINKRLAIMIDGQIVSAPVIRSEIPGGKAMISGSFTWNEARQLSNKINQALKK